MGCGNHCRMHYKISDTFSTHVKRLKTTGLAFTVRFTGLDNVSNLQDFFVTTVDRMLNQALDLADGHDMVGLEIRHPKLDEPILIPFQQRQALNG